MTIGGALSELNNLLKADDIPCYYKPSIKAVMDTIALEQEPQTFKWCDTCKEYDQEKHCCHRYSKVIRDTVEEMKQEQESVIDKIRAEIMDCLKALDDIEKSGFNIYLPNYSYEMVGRRLTYQQCLEFIDKYKAESER